MVTAAPVAPLDPTPAPTSRRRVWFRKNGTDIPNSAMYLNIQNNQSEILQAFNLLVEMKALDYLEVMWEVGNINAEMAAFAATGVHPAVPSIILTVSNNIQGFL
jgi:hypothetical protein